MVTALGSELREGKLARSLRISDGAQILRFGAGAAQISNLKGSV
jgi:hypothetical protein